MRFFLLFWNFSFFDFIRYWFHWFYFVKWNRCKRLNGLLNSLILSKASPKTFALRSRSIMEKRSAAMDLHFYSALWTNEAHEDSSPLYSASWNWSNSKAEMEKAWEGTWTWWCEIIMASIRMTRGFDADAAERDKGLDAGFDQKLWMSFYCCMHLGHQASGDGLSRWLRQP